MPNSNQLVLTLLVSVLVSTIIDAYCDSPCFDNKCANCLSYQFDDYLNLPYFLKMAEKISLRIGTTLLTIESDSQTTEFQAKTEFDSFQNQTRSGSPNGRSNDALKYSWDWFSLHATQRLQAVNFFVVGISFVTTAYVTASSKQFHILAVMICLMGAGIGYVFYKLEERVRELIQHGEKALEKCEDNLANSTGLVETRISKLAKEPKSGIWPYSLTFKRLYLGASIFFIAAAIYELIFGLMLGVQFLTSLILCYHCWH